MKENNVFIRLAKILVAISAVMPMLIHGNDKSSLDISSYIYVLDIKINPKNTNELYAVVALTARALQTRPPARHERQKPREIPGLVTFARRF